MSKLSWKNCFKIGISVFLLYLCIDNVGYLKNIAIGALSAATPLLLGAVIAYVLNILMSFYERHFFTKAKNKFVIKARRPVCLLCAMATLVLVVGLVFALIVPQLIECFRMLFNALPPAINHLFDMLEELKIIPHDVANNLENVDWESKIGQIFTMLYSGVNNVVGIIASTLTTVMSSITTLFVAIIFSIYILIGKEKLCRQCVLLTKRYSKRNVYEKIEYVMKIANDNFHKFIVGQCIEAIILGGLCTIGMLILRLPYAPMIGALTAFTALIPVVGAFIGGGIGAFLILIESPVQALIFLIFIVVLQQLEGNIIYPRVVGSSMGLPGMWVLAAVTIGGGVGGVLGMLVSVPVASTIYNIIKNDVRKAEIKEK